MDKEIDAFKQINTWTMVPPPPHANVIANKWIFWIKITPDGSIDRYKARLIANGFTQISYVDYQETFIPIIKATIIWVILALATMNKWPLHQLDVYMAI